VSRLDNGDRAAGPGDPTDMLDTVAATDMSGTYPDSALLVRPDGVVA
jgi:hypothetical protein